jgi:hypothetical protein
VLALGMTDSSQCTGTTTSSEWHFDHLRHTAAVSIPHMPEMTRPLMCRCCSASLSTWVASSLLTGNYSAHCPATTSAVVLKDTTGWFCQ